MVVFSATLLPSALPLLRSLPGIKLAGDLTGLELSEARLHPVLIASWNETGITLEPGYRLGSGKVLRGSSLEGHIFGRWARIANHLCRVLDPATPLVPFHRRGTQVLTGQDALRFLKDTQDNNGSWSFERPVGKTSKPSAPTLSPPRQAFTTGPASPPSPWKPITESAFRRQNPENEVF